MGAEVLQFTTAREQNIGELIDGELHRLSIPNGGWASRPVFEGTRHGRTAVVLIGRRRERPVGYVPKITADRIFKHQNWPHEMNFSGFAGWSNLEYVLDQERCVKVTYCGEPAGVVLFADHLLEALRLVRE